ncbi:translation initiation factor IF-2-like [Dermacentor silvarum]|uniref:translation initiation factor IF-2-like n=1 Tax=Dermacentor silvarum TaxID=543639 RepID=UPI002100A473|nr:translation initiation factor IF-2-like [Dermacentor silvarum]
MADALRQQQHNRKAPDPSLAPRPGRRIAQDAVQAGGTPQPVRAAARLPRQLGAESAARPTAEPVQLVLPDPSEDLPEEYKDIKAAMMETTCGASPVDTKKPVKSASVKKSPPTKPSARSTSAKSPKSKTPKSKTPVTRTPAWGSPANGVTTRRMLPPVSPTVASSTCKPRGLAGGSPAVQGQQRGQRPIPQPVGLHDVTAPTPAGAAVTSQQRPVLEGRPRHDGGYNAPVKVLPQANPFQNVRFYRPPLLPRGSLWSPDVEVPAPLGLDDGPVVVKDYVHGPQDPLPPDELITARQAAVALLLFLVFLALVVAWGRFAIHNSHGGHTLEHGYGSDSVPTKNKNGDDPAMFIRSSIAIPEDSANSWDDPSALNSTTAD